MKKIFNLLRLALLCALLFNTVSTYAQHKTSAGFVINGHISGVKDGTLVKLFDIDRLKVIDSTVTKSGKFKFTGQVKKPLSCWIQCAGEYATVQVENVPMTFESPLKNMKINYLATGGREQTLESELDKALKPYESRSTFAFDSLNNKLYADSNQRRRLVKAVNHSSDAYMRTYIDFGKEHIDSYLGLGIVYNNRKEIPKDSVILLYKTLPVYLKNSSGAVGLAVFISGNLAKKGQHYIDFDAKTITGKPFKLSNLKGKYIYLTFGSFGCGPCRMENKELSNNYKALAETIDMVNFSMDKNIKEWQAAAKLDGIIWYNVSDLAGMDGKIKTLYDIQAMPTAYLIDKYGMIIERFDGYSTDNLKQIKSLTGIKN